MTRTLLRPAQVLLVVCATAWGCGGEDAPHDGAVDTDASVDTDGSANVVDMAHAAFDAGPPASRQTQVPLGTSAAGNGYYEYLPPGYDGTTPVPLLVFWHGIGENGNGVSDLSKVLANGPPKLIAANKWTNDRPFLVLSPQHKNDGGCPSATEIDTFITFAKGKYAVDPKRVYLTGLSCGAIGSWAYLRAQKDKDVAAALLIAGDPGNAWTSLGCSLVSTLSLWSVHGDMDPTVAFAPDKAEMENLLACPMPRGDVKWTPIAGGLHDTWTKTYDLSGGYGDVYAWMLAHGKP
jgi:poly(3-hydroxybutyrate) depolymerase